MLSIAGLLQWKLLGYIYTRRKSLQYHINLYTLKKREKMYIIAIFLFQIVSLMLIALKEEAALMEIAVSFIKHMLFENYQPNVVYLKQKISSCIFTLNVSLYTEAQTDAPIVEPTDVPTEEPDMSG